MNQSISVSYMHGLGNQFVVIDLVKNQNLDFNQIDAPLIAKLFNQSNKYQQHQPYPIDQVLVLNHPSKKNIDFDYHIINRDGSIAEQCGNGARCIAKYIYDNYPSIKRPQTNQYSLQTNDGKILQLQYFDDHKIRVLLEKENFSSDAIGLNLSEVNVLANHPNYYQFPKLNRKIDLHQSSDPSVQLPIHFYSVSIGNPHLVIDASNQDFENLDIKAIGSFLQNQKSLFKNSVNANFVQIINPNEIKLRTYERGAGETLACGSGACASFVCLKADNRINDKLTIHLPLGSLQLSYFNNEKIEMIGPATFQETRTLEL